jgi:hypothetical protein
VNLQNSEISSSHLQFAQQIVGVRVCEFNDGLIAVWTKTQCKVFLLHTNEVVWEFKAHIKSVLFQRARDIRFCSKGVSAEAMQLISNDFGIVTLEEGDNKSCVQSRFKGKPPKLIQICPPETFGLFLLEETTFYFLER